MTDKEDPVESGAIGLSDTFKDEEQEPVVEAKAEAQAEPESKGEPEPEAKVDEPEANAEPEVETPSTEQESPSVPKQALIDERRKRQALEAELKTLRGKDQSQDDNAPDPITDPDAYKAYLKGQWETERRTEISERSRERMLETTSDYQDMEKYFLTLAQADPSLIEKVKDHHDPAKFAYDYAKEAKGKTFAEVEKQVIEKLRKEGKLKEPNKPPVEVANLIKSPGAGKNNLTVETEVTNVKQLFK